ncbi:lytic polysaccharide monooxygenase [Kribbella sandramycini]|uniref:Chitin-binding protein n=1 Tax=Kribbella sandramycini TaxID=60450 RepID=A0A7Y4KVQ7_9ACTN|nr:lytic polysaccharide monooxygenase [Kribbella sandramycini]MBB6567882.1 chitin-binding protein [Kribbella sandramycini]NOL39523.1 lytic polysaccharide monooxygenase [Kribbella sandramycini]
MLRSRKITMAGVAVGALALTSTLFTAPLAYGHGYTNFPVSRAKNCQSGVVKDCGPIQWEPQSVEGPKGFPSGGPADGRLCSGGLGQFGQLDGVRTPAPANAAWPIADTNRLSSGATYTFRWWLTAPHATTDFKYYITKNGWDQNAPLRRSSLELTPFSTVPYNGQRPPNDFSHRATLPGGKSGRHMILAVWTIHDTVNAFYQCSDVQF